MLRTLGAKRRQILATRGHRGVRDRPASPSALGVLAGIGFAPAISALFEALGIDLPATGTVIAPRTMIVGLVLGTGSTVVAALLPALRATRVPPVTGLREGAVLADPARAAAAHRAPASCSPRSASRRCCSGCSARSTPARPGSASAPPRVFLGVALLSPRLVTPLASVVGAPLERLRGVPGRLARENAVRNPGRTAVDRRGADDRAGAGLVRRRLRRRAPRLDRRRDRQDASPAI